MVNFLKIHFNTQIKIYQKHPVIRQKSLSNEKQTTKKTKQENKKKTQNKTKTKQANKNKITTTTNTAMHYS